MSHFAKIENGVVTQVIVAEQDFIDTGAVGDPAQWIQTSYNTRGGVHVLGGTPLRRNFAGIGYFYIPEQDVFIPPKPFNSWSLNTENVTWEPPTPRPEDEKFYIWDEETLNWIETVSVLPGDQ